MVNFLSIMQWFSKGANNRIKSDSAVYAGVNGRYQRPSKVILPVYFERQLICA
jgi:hypothetical protein